MRWQGSSRVCNATLSRVRRRQTLIHAGLDGPEPGGGAECDCHYGQGRDQHRKARRWDWRGQVGSGDLDRAVGRHDVLRAEREGKRACRTVEPEQRQGRHRGERCRRNQQDRVSTAEIAKATAARTVAAPTAATARTTAAQTGAAVLVGWGERLSWGRGYRINFHELDQGLADNLDDAVQRMNREMEALIRACPTQYLWGYGRYKSPRKDAAPGAKSAEVKPG